MERGEWEGDEGEEGNRNVLEEKKWKRRERWKRGRVVGRRGIDRSKIQRECN